MTEIVFEVLGFPAAQPRPRARVLRLPGGRYTASFYDEKTRVDTKTGKKVPTDIVLWRRAVSHAAAPHLPATPFSAPMFVSMWFRFDRPKDHYSARGGLKPWAGELVWYDGPEDVDNLAKAVMDELTERPDKEDLKNWRHGLWKDDHYVVRLLVEKRWAKIGELPGAIVKITVTGGPDSQATIE